MAVVAVITMVSGTSCAGTTGRSASPTALAEAGAGYVAVRDDRPDSAGVVTFFAIGDSGDPGAVRDRVAGVLRTQVGAVSAREVRPFVLMAGDNLCPDGLPSGWPTTYLPGLLLDRAFDQPFGDTRYHGSAVSFNVVPGEHDDRADGYLWETFAERRFDGRNGRARMIFFPYHSPLVEDTNSRAEYDGLRAVADSGGVVNLPEEVGIATDRLSIIALDTEAMIDLAAENSPRARTAWRQQWDELARLLALHRALPWIVILGHHPIVTHGRHGGYRPWPMGLHIDKAVAGLRGLLHLGDRQDTDHKAYRRFVAHLRASIRACAGPRCVYISGHDHSLQVLDAGGGLVQVVSGAASKTSAVSTGPDTIFSARGPGLFRFDLAGNELWIEPIEAEPDDHAAAMPILRFRASGKHDK